MHSFVKTIHHFPTLNENTVKFSHFKASYDEDPKMTTCMSQQKAMCS